jgi:Tol biopolymer transport system component
MGFLGWEMFAQTKGREIPRRSTSRNDRFSRVAKPWIIAGAAILALTLLPLAWTQSSATTDTSAAQGPQAQDASAKPPVDAKDALVLELPNNQWWEGPLERVRISPDGRWSLVNRTGSLPLLQLYSLKTGKDDRFTLMSDLNRVDNAAFCGPHGIALVGERIAEDGWFLPHNDDVLLSSLPADAFPVCGKDEREVAYFRIGASDQEVFINLNGRVRGYGVSGRVIGMGFSPDGDTFYDLLFEPNGQSSLVRINVNTGAAKSIANHLDANPRGELLAISPDGRKIYLSLASDGAADNEARHQPDADRWLKIYELDPATGARRRVVDTPGQDNNAPTVVGNNLYWTRTVYHASIALLPAAGGDAKEIVIGGQLPMWSPDSKRISYFFGGMRLADWALNWDDAVVGIDEQGNIASQPSIIVSGYGEDFPPAWSPDGKWIAFHSHRSRSPIPEYGAGDSTDDIYLRRADDVHAPEMRLTDFGWETGPAYWSPDGTKLMFRSWDRNGQPDIGKLFVITLQPDTGHPVKVEKLSLPSEIRSSAWAAWSPSGEEIAVEDDRGGEDRSLWTMHLDGSHAEKLLDYKGTTHDGVDWMPDGKSIVYSALADGRMQLFSLSHIGGAPRLLSRDSGNLLHPKVSPDGNWIACTRLVQSKQIWRRPLN